MPAAQDAVPQLLGHTMKDDQISIAVLQIIDLAFKARRRRSLEAANRSRSRWEDLKTIKVPDDRYHSGVIDRPRISSSTRKLVAQRMSTLCRNRRPARG